MTMKVFGMTHNARCVPRLPRSTIPSLVAAIGLLTITWAVHAADTDGAFAAKGIGTNTCKDFVEARNAQSNEYYRYGGWINGYITALNQIQADTFDITSFETTDFLAAVIANHCTNNPDDRFANVMMQMARQLSETKLETYSQRTVVGGQTGTLYNVTIQRMQQKLKDGGFYKGQVDGQIGEGTKAALKAFQEAKGLPVSGEPDQSTLLVLFRDQGK